MTQAIPDFTDHEKWIIQSAIDERWGKNIDTTQEVNVDLQLSPGDRELTSCPAILLAIQ